MMTQSVLSTATDLLGFLRVGLGAVSHICTYPDHTPSRVLDGYWQPWYGTVPSYTAECYRRLNAALEGVEEGGDLEASRLEEHQRA